jgi:hypothetical protein
MEFPRRLVVRKFRVHIGHSTGCGQRVKSRHGSSLWKPEERRRFFGGEPLLPFLPGVKWPREWQPMPQVASIWERPDKKCRWRGVFCRPLVALGRDGFFLGRIILQVQHLKTANKTRVAQRPPLGGMESRFNSQCYRQGGFAKLHRSN